MHVHRLLATAALSLGSLWISACKNEPGSGAASGDKTSSSSGAGPSKSSERSGGASLLPSKAVATTGEVQSLDKKTKVGFSIELPEGMKDVSEESFAKEFGTGKDKFEDYALRITVVEKQEEVKKLGIDGFMKEVEKVKGKVLQKESWDNGFIITAQITEGPKKAILANAFVWKGTTTLDCHGSVEGPLAADDKAESTGNLLNKACRSLTITSP